ncbi:GNAT family N-acetyltransferase [Streptomyces sp. NPDC047043]|uniref:GNAT family N-acetyltransferase n=1 Tax=Streptomyces sp. NPDC047043 TaxID=3154497 RepID=UPI0033C0F306
MPHVSARLASPADIDSIVSTFTSAFFHDPVWGSAFPDERRRAAQAAVMWRVYVTSALRYPWTFVTPDAEAAALWIPPGGVELLPEEVAGLERNLARVTDPDTARAIMAVGEQFEAVHPAEPFFYLTILGTHTDHRGKGLGMALLAESLARIDEVGAPAYLESTNPANLKRYESVGFAVRDEIVLPTGQVVTTMWRAASVS